MSGFDAYARPNGRKAGVGAGGETTRGKKDEKWSKGPLIFLFVVVVMVIANFQIHLPYFVLAPGSAQAVKGYVDLPPDKSQGQSGQVLLATVSIKQANPMDWLLAHVLPGRELKKRETILGPSTTQAQYIEQNKDAMTASQRTAIEVAMTRAGYAVTEKGEGAQIAGVGEEVPASGKLNVNDVVTAVNGVSVTTADDAVETIKDLRVGDIARFDVMNLKQEKRTVDITLAARPDDQKGLRRRAFENVQSQSRHAFSSLV